MAGPNVSNTLPQALQCWEAHTLALWVTDDPHPQASSVLGASSQHWWDENGTLTEPSQT